MQLDRRAQITDEADRLEQALRRMKEEEKSQKSRAAPGLLPQIGSQSDRSRHYDYKKILYRDDEEKKYLGNTDAIEHRRRMQTYRSVSARVGVGH